MQGLLQVKQQGAGNCMQTLPSKVLLCQFGCQPVGADHVFQRSRAGSPVPFLQHTCQALLNLF